MVFTYKDWYEMLSFSLQVYHTAIRTSIRVTLYTLVYEMGAVIPLEVEILSLRVLIDFIKEGWPKYEQLNLISEKRIAAICHHQFYQRRMAKSYNKKIRT